MAAPKKQFCPRGHDKDAPGAVRIYTYFIRKGVKKSVRECRKCRAIISKKYRLKMITIPIEDLQKAINCLNLFSSNKQLTMFDRAIAKTTAASLETHLNGTKREV